MNQPHQQNSSLRVLHTCYVLAFAMVMYVFVPEYTYAQEAPASAKRFREAVSILGADSLEGRGTGTRGAEIASAYIAGQLHDAGIAPAGGQGSYFQSIPMHGSYPIRDCRFMLETRSEKHTLKLWDDYVLYKTGAGTFIPTPLPLVFVGYGIVAPEYGYNDYAGMDVNNAIVVFLEGEPQSDDPAYFEGAIGTYHSYAERKQQIAFSRGARGSIMIRLPRLRHTGDSWLGTVQDFSFEHVTLLYGVPENLAALVNTRIARLLFTGADYSYSEVLAMDSTGNIHSFALEATASFHGHFLQRDFVGRNVAGIIRGSDPQLQDSYLLLSAHYDHLGIGPAIRSDSIYNGVADNAMGVAALLEIARALNSNPPKRSVLVLFVTGEEKGLLGSRYYCDNPLVPLYKTIANLNIDGVAMFDKFRDVIGIGAELSSIGTQLEEAAAKTGLAVSEIPLQFRNEDVFERSDQLAFAAAGIPSVLVMDGLHSETLSYRQTLSLFISWGRNMYHTPFDDLDQPINYTASMQHVAFLLQFAETLANSATPPEWNEGTEYRNVRLRTIDEKR